MGRLLQLVLLLFATISGVTPVVATSPATPEQILCGRDYIFIGRAIAATPVRARPGYIMDYKNAVHLTIVVRRMIGAKDTSDINSRANPVLNSGDRVQATAVAYSSPGS
jgi:hypothetical protein